MKYEPINLLNVSLCFDQSNQSDIAVGRLALQGKKIWFEYVPDFLTRGLLLSPFKLPLKPGAIIGEESMFQGLFGLFNDSLPDGWGRLLLDRKMRLQGVSPEQLTPLDRLAYVGKQGMGALSYKPEKLSGQMLSGFLDLNKIAEEAQQVRDTEVFFEDLLLLNASSCGARPKINVGVSATKQQIISCMDSLPKEFEPWLIKFPSSQDPKDVGAIEWAYHLMAKQVGLDVPEAFLFSGQYFGCKRFDRENNQRIHMHTLAGLLHADYRMPSLDYEDYLKVVYQLTKNHEEVEKAYRLAVFNVLAHNRDDHSKNFSFLMDTQGVWRLAPAYDLVFSYGPGGEQSMTVMGEGKNPGILQLQTLAEKFSISQASAIIEQVVASLRQWSRFAEEAGVSSNSSSIITSKLKVP